MCFMRERVPLPSDSSVNHMPGPDSTKPFSQLHAVLSTNWPLPTPLLLYIWQWRSREDCGGGKDSPSAKAPSLLRASSLKLAWRENSRLSQVQPLDYYMGLEIIVSEAHMSCGFKWLQCSSTTQEWAEKHQQLPVLFSRGREGYPLINYLGTVGDRDSSE